MYAYGILVIESRGKVILENDKITIMLHLKVIIMQRLFANKQTAIHLLR